jgi:hypothetical protein
MLGTITSARYTLSDINCSRPDIAAPMARRVQPTQSPWRAQTTLGDTPIDGLHAFGRLALEGVRAAKARDVSSRQQADRPLQCPPWTGEPIVDLVTVRLAANAPLTEVLTVVPQDRVAIFSDARTRSVDDSIAIEPTGCAGSDPDRVPPREFRHGNLFHRSPPQTSRQPSILHDRTVTHIDTVMCKPAAQCDYVSTQGWFLV